MVTDGFFQINDFMQNLKIYGKIKVKYYLLQLVQIIEMQVNKLWGLLNNH